MYTKSHERLLTWYQNHGRHDLPWRKSRDAYKIWISEVMLQQTQVKTVLERFYVPFLEAFPTLAELAAADLDEVLKKWEGLGYYTRARHLHKTARLCQDALPLHVSELQQLPGIGRSTAHAIAAFAYNTPVPILDANVRRILHRHFGKKQMGEKEAWQKAEALFDTTHPFEYNQAMMDLGAMLCQAKSSECQQCPLQLTCKASREDPLAFPEKKAKKTVPVRRRVITVFCHEERFGLLQRRGRFLHGLWGFFETEGLHVSPVEKLGSLIQKYSHFHLHADVYLSRNYQEDLEWFSLEEINTLALSGADQKVLELLVSSS